MYIKAGRFLEKLDLFYDYYKETFSLSKQAQSRRNKYYVILCALEALSFLFLIQPDKVAEVFSAGISTQLNTSLAISNKILQTFLWILIAYFTVRYCQDTLYIERLYPYLDKLEKEISMASNSTIFDREGEGYVKDYPIVLNFIDLFYKMFSPILFMIINSVRISKEWCENAISLSLICDSAIFFTTSVIIWFYFFEIHSKITNWCKKYVPFVATVAKFLRKILKEV